MNKLSKSMTCINCNGRMMYTSTPQRFTCNLCGLIYDWSKVPASQRRPRTFIMDSMKEQKAV